MRIITMYSSIPSFPTQKRTKGHPVKLPPLGFCIVKCGKNVAWAGYGKYPPEVNIRSLMANQPAPPNLPPPERRPYIRAY